MLIRDTVAAQERLSVLQFKIIRSGLFNRHKMTTKIKQIKIRRKRSIIPLKMGDNLRNDDGST